MQYDFSVNERYSVEKLVVGRERHPVLIVDNYLKSPEALISYAAQEARFHPSPAMYPGVVAPAPDAYIESYLNVLGPLLGDTFGVKPETAYLTNGFFAIVTFPAEQLHYRQRLPHVDDYGPGAIAVLHYLCDGTQGGTALYRHRATGYESLTKEKFERVQSLIAQDIAGQGPLLPEYMSGHNRYFEQIASFEAKFNRLVIYRGSIFHSMVVMPGTRLDPNPRIGRLTTNTFLLFETA